MKYKCWRAFDALEYNGMKKNLFVLVGFFILTGFVSISCSQPVNDNNSPPILNEFYTVSDYSSGPVVFFPQGSSFQLYINVTDPDGDINKWIVMVTFGNNTEELLNISSASSSVPDGRLVTGTYSKSFTTSGTGSVAFTSYVEDWKGNKSNTITTVATFFEQ